MPKTEMNWESALTELVVIDRRGYAAGYLVAWHMTVKRYYIPDIERGRGPTQSMIMCSNGSPMADIGCKWTGVIT